MSEGFVIKCKECNTEVMVESWNDLRRNTDSHIRVFTDTYHHSGDTEIVFNCKCNNTEVMLD